MIRTIYLYGDLGRKFGWRHRFDVETVAEVVRALSANFPGFSRAFFKGPAYSIVRGTTRREGRFMEGVELPIRLGKDDIHIIPAAYGRGGGSSGKSVGKVILGVAMIGLAIVQPEFLFGATGVTFAEGVGAGGETLASAVGASSGILTGVVTAAKVGTFGAMMALSGIAQLISPTPQMGNYGQLESPAQRTSFLYNGPTNTTQQGGPIPILYGLMRVGSTLVSATVTTEDTNNPAAVNPIPGVSLETIFDGSKG